MVTPSLAREIRETLTDPFAVCEALGIERSRTERFKWKCPRHGGTSLSVRSGPDRTLQIRCFGCDLAGDVFALVAEVHGLSVRTDFRSVLAVAADLAGRRGAVLQRPIKALPAPVGERRFPPRIELAAMLAAAVPTSKDDEVARALVARGLRPEVVDDLDLGRALPRSASLPSWASFQRMRWTETGHRLLLPVVDAAGVVRSVRAWRVTPGETPKRLPPAGCKASGLVLACPFARAVLAGSQRDDLAVLVVEGEPDFLTWATRFSDADEVAPMVLGIVSGSWSPDFAVRIPDRARVVIRTHHDPQGDRYAGAIATTLARRCSVFRSREAA